MTESLYVNAMKTASPATETDGIPFPYDSNDSVKTKSAHHFYTSKNNVRDNPIP